MSEEKTNHVATCGHYIDGGITFSIEDGEYISYGSYCAECAYRYWQEGRIVNRDMTKLLERLVCG